MGPGIRDMASSTAPCAAAGTVPRGVRCGSRARLVRVSIGRARMPSLGREVSDWVSRAGGFRHEGRRESYSRIPVAGSSQENRRPPLPHLRLGCRTRAAAPRFTVSSGNSERWCRRPETGSSCTTSSITHRVAAASHCDEIIVLEQGKITQRGTHEELWRSGGLYAELLKAGEGVPEEAEA